MTVTAPAPGLTPRRRVLAAAGVLGLVLAVVPAAPAAASAVVVTDPGDGAQLASAPQQVRLELSDTPDVADSHVSVLDGRGTILEAGELTAVAGSGLSENVHITGTGDFTIAYHVVFGDGSEATGYTRFSVGTNVPPAPMTATAADAARQASAGHEHGVDPLSGVLLLVDAVVLGAVLILLLRRPGRPWRYHDPLG